MFVVEGGFENDDPFDQIATGEKKKCQLIIKDIEKVAYRKPLLNWFSLPIKY